MSALQPPLHHTIPSLPRSEDPSYAYKHMFKDDQTSYCVESINLFIFYRAACNMQCRRSLAMRKLSVRSFVCLSVCQTLTSLPQIS